jgi:hypothetical protein
MRSGTGSVLGGLTKDMNYRAAPASEKRPEFRGRKSGRIDEDFSGQGSPALESGANDLELTGCCSVRESLDGRETVKR